MNHALLRSRLGCSDGRTVLREAFHRAPLKIARSFPRADGGLGLCVMDCSPGLLAGDTYQLDWHLESGARVHIWNQGFARVHPARSSSGSTSTCGSSLRQSFRLEAGARLYAHPQPVMLFADAEFCSRTRVEMKPGSSCMLSEIVCAGRVERGEAFRFRSWRSVLEVEHADELIFASRQKCEPSRFDFASPAAWNGRTHWAQVLAISDTLDSHHRGDLLSQWRELLGAAGCWGGASLMIRAGLSASFLCWSAWEAQAVARQLSEAFEAWDEAAS